MILNWARTGLTILGPLMDGEIALSFATFESHSEGEVFQ